MLILLPTCSSTRVTVSAAWGVPRAFAGMSGVEPRGGGHRRRAGREQTGRSDKILKIYFAALAAVSAISGFWLA
ncbi:MAG: hypothetical protein HY865_10410 [Chloroflexi bacterium]|nr:hypothetical protein [Chloroflexota bacterium]